MHPSKRFSRASKKFRPSPAMVVAIAALLVALSGSAYAAVTINGKNIKSSTVTGKQIKNSSLTGADIKNSSVSGTDLKDGTVSGTDVKDGSIAAGDLASGAVVPPPIGTVTSTTAYSPPVSLSYSDIPGMSLSYTAPAGTTKLILTFQAECDVNYTADSQYLGAQILVDGTAPAPDDVANQFCTVDSVDNYSQTSSNSITRVIPAGPGTHEIKAQAVEILLANGTLDNMILTVTPSS